MSEDASLYDSVIDEFLHSYPRGARLIAVSSPDRERSSAFADRLADAFTAHGTTATVRTPDAADADTLRTELIAPFRSTGEDGVLLVAGGEELLDRGHRGLWHFRIWLLAGDEAPHTAASTLVDVTDPQHPVRHFADYCAVPKTFRT